MNETISVLDPLAQATYDSEICAAARRSMTRAGWTYDRLAAALGRPMLTVWNWLNGRVNPPAGMVPAMARLGLDGALKKSAELAERGLIPTGAFLRKAHSDKPVRAHVLLMAQEFGVVAAEVESSLRDGDIDGQESIKIDDAMSALEKQIWALRARIKKGES